jgi:thymidylate synthase ThyX
MMTETFTAAERAILAPYVTNIETPIYALQNLPEEVVAVLFAYYSRSRDPLRRNLLKLIQDQDIDLEARRVALTGQDSALGEAQERARQFHEKWVVGYGHASVAEHAVVHLAIEDVSIIATKIIEDSRLASYTEKSTRYVLFDDDRFYRVPRLMSSPYASLYEDTVRFLLKTYGTLVPPLVEHIKATVPQRGGQSERAHDTACRAKAYDLLRYLIPACTLTNLGMTINARALEHLLTKLFSHPLDEVRHVAVLMKQEAMKIVPTLLKYADYNVYLAETEQALQQLSREVLTRETAIDTPTVSLVRYPDDAEEQLTAAILYRYSHLAWRQVCEQVSKLSPTRRQDIIDEYLKRRGPHDQPLRALEHLYYTFDIVLDFGAFRDIQRHRMATQTRQDLSIDYGYSLPEELIAYGLQQPFVDGMARAADAYTQIAAEFPLEAQYVLPLAYRVRVLFTWNLRELCHFIQLRSAKQGHPSYRSIAQLVYRELERVHPVLARYIRVDLADYSLGRL